MKKTDLTKQLAELAKNKSVVFEKLREGANHEVWAFNGRRISIPRHREINEITAQAILGTAEETLG